LVTNYQGEFASSINNLLVKKIQLNIFITITSCHTPVIPVKNRRKKNMKCAVCNTQDTKVIDSRLLLDGAAIRRRRKCDNCSHRFTTYEKIEIILPDVVKNDGRRESFNREKILKGVKKACQKRPISVIEIDKLIESIEKEIIENHKNEVTTPEIGQLVMRKLHLIDPVAYVRFASFYWNFDNIDDFILGLKNDLKNKSRGHLPSSCSEDGLVEFD